MKTVKITLEAHPHLKDVSDGIAMRKHGDVITVDDEAANALIAGKFAIPLDCTSIIEARRQNEIAAYERRIEATQARAIQQMRIHDALPEEVRAVAQEHDGFANIYLESQIQKQESEPEEPAKKRRGRPPKGDQHG